MTVPCPTCFTPIKLTHFMRLAMKRGREPRCPVCHPRPAKCAVCNGAHRTKEHSFTGKAVCQLCGDMSWRVVGPRCKRCRLTYADEEPVELEDVMHSPMGRVADLGGSS